MRSECAPPAAFGVDGLTSRRHWPGGHPPCLSLAQPHHPANVSRSCFAIVALLLAPASLLWVGDRWRRFGPPGRSGSYPRPPRPTHHPAAPSRDVLVHCTWRCPAVAGAFHTRAPVAQRIEQWFPNSAGPNAVLPDVGRRTKRA